MKISFFRYYLTMEQADSGHRKKKNSQKLHQKSATVLADMWNVCLHRQMKNLNSRQLLNNRVSAWKTLMRSMSQKNDKTWTVEFIRKYIEKLSGADDKTAYSGFLIYLLKQKVGVSD